VLQAFKLVLYRLLGHPEHIEPLREEAEAVVAEAGWTKAGMDKMHKIDSFVRETLRLNDFGICSSTIFTAFFNSTSFADA
jgi:hypothetical protein